jgi:hypothetical protein
MAFVKLHEGIVKSSIMCESIHVRLVWLLLLAIADRDGYVEGAPSALARMFNVTPEQLADAFNVLTSPDPESRSKTEDGRRLVAAGNHRWLVVNYMHYRQLQSEEDRREKTRERVQRFRERHAMSHDVTPCNACNDIAEAEAEAEADKNTCPPDDRFVEFWFLYPRKTAKKRAESAWHHLTATQRVVALAALPDHITYWKNTRRPTDKIPHAATWINGEYWQDQLPAVDADTGKVQSAWADKFDAKGNPL